MEEKVVSLEHIASLAKEVDIEDLAKDISGSKVRLPHLVSTKAAGKDKFPEVKNRTDITDRLVKFVVSSDITDRQNHIIKIEGILIKNYKRNPVILFAHSKSIPPIGRSVFIEKDLSQQRKRLISIGEFFEEDVFQLSETIYRMLVKGYLNAVSIGFVPKDIKTDVDDEKSFKLIFNKVDMVEYSIVPIPANPEALVIDKSLDHAEIKNWVEMSLDEWEKTEYGLLFKKENVENAYKILNRSRSVTSGKKAMKVSKEDQLEILRKNLERIKKKRESEMNPESGESTTEYRFDPFIIKNDIVVNTETEEEKRLKDDEGNINYDVGKEIIKKHAEFLQKSEKDIQEIEDSLLKLGKILGIDEKVLEQTDEQDNNEIDKENDNNEEKSAEIVNCDDEQNKENEENSDIDNTDSQLVEKETEETEEEPQNENLPDIINKENEEDDENNIDITEQNIETKEQHEIENKENDKKADQKVIIKSDNISVEIIGENIEIAKEIVSIISSAKQDIEENEEKNKSADNMTEKQDENKDIDQNDSEVSIEEIKSIVEEILPEVLDEIVNLEKEVRKGNLDLILKEKE